MMTTTNTSLPPTLIPPSRSENLARVQNRACQTCATAKAKCVASSNPDQPCARCLRLGKVCMSATSRERRRRAPKQASRHAQLQEKLDSLVSLLSNPRAADEAPTNPLEHVSSGRRVLEANSERPIHRGLPVRTDSALASAHMLSLQKAPEDTAFSPGSHTGPSEPLNNAATATASVTDSSTILRRNGQPTGCRTRDVSFSPHLQPSISEAEHFLKTFKHSFFPRFPFVTIPELSAQRLRLHRPHVWRSVMMVSACYEPLRQLAMGQEILRTFSECLLLGAEKSLDLLQGLMICTAWHHYQFKANPGTTSILQLTLGLMCDLQLKTPRSEQEDEMFPYSMHNAIEREHNQHQEVSHNQGHVTEERRAFLGCFVLASVMSLSYSRVEKLNHSSYVDSCCQVLTEAKEVETDSYLVAIVRLQCLAGRFFDALSHRLPFDSYEILVNLLRGELQTFERTLTPRLRESSSLILQFHNTEIHLYQFSLKVLPSLSATAATDLTAGIYRLQVLELLLKACQSFFSVYMSIEPSMYLTLSLLELSYLPHALSTFLRLSLLNAPGWDLERLRRHLDVSSLLGQLAKRFEQASGFMYPPGTAPRTDTFALISRRLNRIRRWHDQKWSDESQAGDNEISRQNNVQRHQYSMTCDVNAGGDVNLPSLDNQDSLNFLDDIWWHDIQSDVDWSSGQAAT